MTEPLRGDPTHSHPSRLSGSSRLSRSFVPYAPLRRLNFHTHHLLY